MNFFLGFGFVFGFFVLVGFFDRIIGGFGFFFRVINGLIGGGFFIVLGVVGLFSGGNVLFNFGLFVIGWCDSDVISMDL